MTNCVASHVLFDAVYQDQLLESYFIKEITKTCLKVRYFINDGGMSL